MKISELIKELKKIEKQNGDLKVFVDDGYILGDGVAIRIQNVEDNETILIIR